MENLKYFKSSIVVSLAGIIAAFAIGGMEALFLVSVLCVLEVSLSFDNAVVNATVLKDMDDKWRHRFMTWGILIAVFGMRIIFPVAVVSIIAGISPWGAIDIAINNPELYADYMSSAHISLMGFGGTFLMMVGLDFFLDEYRDHYWFPAVEKKVKELGNYDFMPAIITLGLTFAIGALGLEGNDFKDFIISGACGVVMFLAIHHLAQWMEDREEKRAEAMKATGAVAKGGFAMFMYLEILDASFSFDGVIGAFAITTNLLIIAIGLGAGAMFVRSLTIMLVEKDTLAEYEYLEHGAFYAIIALAGMMLLKSVMHVPEAITGLIGAAFIGLAFYDSLKKNKEDELQAKAEESPES